MFHQSGTSHKQVDIEILVSSTESNHFSGPYRRRRYLIRVDGLRKKYGKWIDQSSKQRHLPPEHIYIESDESNDTKNQNQNQNDGDVVNCEVAASMGGLKKPTLVANQKGEVDHHGKHENVNGNKGKSSSCIVLSDSDFETPEQLREKKTNVSGKRKRITKSASTSSHKKKRTETTSVGKRKFFNKDWSTGKVKDGVKGSILRKKICSCLRKTRDTCKRKKIEKAAKAAKAAKAKPNTEDRKQILVRTSPNTFANMVRALSDEQKKWVVDVGFGSILSFSLTKFPLKLAYNVVWSYNMDDFEMDLLAGKIPITEDDVHEVLGLPQGPRRIQIVKNEDAEKSWRSQYKDAKKPWKVTAKRVYEKMKTSSAVDDHFKNNFLVMMCNMMIEAQKNSFLNQSILGFRDIDKSSDYNWCEYLILSLHDPSEYWLVNPKTRHYYGPLLFLIYFYLDRVHNQRWNVIRKVPTFSGWTTLMIQQRQNYEEINKSFGRGKILGAVRLTNESNNDIVNDKMKEEPAQDGETEPMAENSNLEVMVDAIVLNLSENCRQVKEDKMKEEPAQDGETEPMAENSNLEVMVDAIVLNLSENCRQVKEDEMKEEPAQDGETELENLVQDENDKVNINIANITHNVEENISTFDEDIDIKENVFLETLESNINHIEKITQICRADLVIARALFSENNKVNELEMRFAKLHESSINTPWSRKEQNYSTPSQRIFDHDGRNMQNEFDSVAVGSVKMDAEQRAEYTVEDNKIEERPHRDLKMANVLKSPFYDRTADINGKTLTVDEARTWRWLNRNQDNPNQTVFEWNQIKCFKAELQSLRLNEQILASVIDTWACICNVLEDMRAPESPRRLFCTIETTVGTLSRRNQKSTNLMYTNFARNLDHICEKYGVKLNDVDMIFFPIHDINHYYLICYNLKNPSVEIIDNSAYCGSATNIYDGFPESLHKHFIKYLRQNLFRRIIQMRLVQFVRLEMPWRTTSNQVDCGIFVMRHMEKYKADGSRGWSDFYHEGPNQSRQLARLRTLYCHKIIGSPLNIWKDLPIYELE